jgi:hypothetical protein
MMFIIFPIDFGYHCSVWETPFILPNLFSSFLFISDITHHFPMFLGSWISPTRGLGPLRDDGVQETVTVRPGEGEKWAPGSARAVEGGFPTYPLVN